MKTPLFQTAEHYRVPVLSPDQERELCRRLVHHKLELQSLVLLTAAGLDALEDASKACAGNQCGALHLQLQSLRKQAAIQDEARDRSGPADQDSDPTPVRIEHWRNEVAGLLAQASLPEAAQERLLATCRDSSHTSHAGPPTGTQRYLHARMRHNQQELDQLKAHLIAANQGLVRFVVRRYAGLGLSLADLAQEGNIGLMRAVDKYDVERGVRFTTYAVWWIRQAARRALTNQARTIRLPVHAFDARKAVSREQVRLHHELGHQPSAEDLERTLGLAPGAIERALNLVKEPLSLEAPRGIDGDARLLDSLADFAQDSSEATAWANQRRLRLEGLLAELTPREASMMRMRFGLIEGETESTLEEIGSAFGLTRERARQIVDSGLGKLRRAAARQGIDLS